MEWLLRKGLPIRGLEEYIFNYRSKFLTELHSSFVSKYVPFYAINASVVNEENMEVYYWRPSIRQYDSVGSYAEFFSGALSLRYGSGIKLSIKTKDITNYCIDTGLTFFISKNQRNPEKVLASLVVDRDYLISEELRDVETCLDTEKLKFIIDRDVINNIELKSFSKKFKEDVVNKMIDVGIDVIYTKDLDNKLYTPVVEPLKFNNMTERNNMLREGYKDFLFYEREEIIR